MAESSPAILGRFVRGRGSREENRDVVRTFLRGGTGGTEMTREGLFARSEAAADHEYGATLDRVLGRSGAMLAAVEREIEDAVVLLADLEGLVATSSPGEALDRMRQEERWHTWAVADGLRRRSFETGLSDPAKAVALARLAVEAARLPDGRPESRRLRHDLLAATHGQLGNAQRVASELRESERTFETAFEHLDRGTGDPLEAGRLLSLKASLEKDLSRFDEAVVACKLAARRYRRSGDGHLVGRVLIQQATCHAYAGELALAIAVVRRGIEAIDSEREPRLALVAQHNLISYLNQDGEHGEAWDLIGETRELSRRLGHELDLVRLRWLEGRIAVNLGRLGEAETCLREAREAFLEQGVEYDAALVTLELAELCGRLGRQDEMRRLTAEALPVFQEQDVHREAQVTLQLLIDGERYRHRRSRD